MNFSTIQSAREELGRYENNYQELTKKINLLLFSLSRTNLNSEEKNRMWKGLSEYTRNLIAKVEKTLLDFENILFSGDEEILVEEKDNLSQKYKDLIGKLQKEKETILREIRKESTPFVPLRKKTLNPNYCYFDDVDISSTFPYKLKKEEQAVLGIEIPEGAEFCSQECLLDYCKEYRDKEKFRQDEEKKNKEKIENDRRRVTEIQEKIGNLVKRINNLERKERELELLEKNSRGEEKRSLGFFGRIWLRLGLIKENDPRILLQNSKDKKVNLSIELERENEKLQKALVTMSIDEQNQKKMLAYENERISDKNKITENKEKEIEKK